MASTCKISAQLICAAALASLVATSSGCDGKPAEAASLGRGRPSPQGGLPERAEVRKKAAVTPALIAASERLLQQHADAPIGSEFPLTVEGKRLVARIEEHDNPSGAPGRPPGKHKGVTVYEP